MVATVGSLPVEVASSSSCADRAALLRSLEQQGLDHDRATPDRLDRYRNIGPETGEFLHLFVMATAPRSILEVGTSNGYSTIWLGDAAERAGAVVTSVDEHPRQEEAEDNLARAGLLADVVRLHRGRAQTLLADLGSHDLVFLDAERSEYVDLWPLLEGALNQNGTLIVDNAISHADEMRPLLELVGQQTSWATWLVPVGSGQLIIRRLPET